MPKKFEKTEAFFDKKVTLLAGSGKYANVVKKVFEKTKNKKNVNNNIGFRKLLPRGRGVR